MSMEALRTRDADPSTCSPVVTAAILSMTHKFFPPCVKPTRDGWGMSTCDCCKRSMSPSNGWTFSVPLLVRQVRVGSLSSSRWASMRSLSVYSFTNLTCPTISGGEEVEIHSFVLGVPICFTLSTLCEILNLPNEGDCVYLIFNDSITMFSHTGEQSFQPFSKYLFPKEGQSDPSETQTQRFLHLIQQQY